LFITWFDGANGGDGYYGGAKEKRTIDRSTYYGWPETWAIVRKLQPCAAIFGDVGPDVRWVGDENGVAGDPCWETYTPHAPDSGKMPGNGYVKDEEGINGQRDGKYWMPAECDVPLRPGWFYHSYDDTGKNIPWITIRGTDWGNDHYAKTPEQLIELYYKSVGRAACLDIGLSPNRKGELSDHDTYELQQFGLLLKNTFAVNFAKGATIYASNIRAGNKLKFGPAHLLDGDRYSYWATDDKVKTPQLILDMHKAQTFDIIQLRENIKLGQRIEGVAIDAFENGKWEQIATATSIGANRIIHLQKEITSKKVRLRITKSPVSIALSDFGLYKQAKRNDIEISLENFAPG
jgi:alpha-L-fucosidase